jgi:hypothetical protein
VRAAKGLAVANDGGSGGAIGRKGGEGESKVNGDGSTGGTVVLVKANGVTDGR